MNFLALYPNEFESNLAVLEGNRAAYAEKIHNCKLNKKYQIVVIGQGRSTGQVIFIEESKVILELSTIQPVSLELNIILAVGICRPQSVKKVLQSAVIFGVREVVFLASENSEKSYFSSKILSDNVSSDRIILEAIEQTGMPSYPNFRFVKKFSKFFEEPYLKGPSINQLRISTDTNSSLSLLKVKKDLDGSPTEFVLVIGPEKGWTKVEKKYFEQSNFVSVGLGPAMMRVEDASSVALTQIKTLFEKL